MQKLFFILEVFMILTVTLLKVRINCIYIYIFPFYFLILKYLLCYLFHLFLIETSFQTFDTLHSLNEFNLIRLSDFYDNNYLSEYHEFIIGAYIRFYKYEKGNNI